MGIVVAAIVTAAVALAAGVFLLSRLAGRSLWGILTLCVLVMLPMQPLMFYAVRLPVDGVLQGALGTGALYGFVATFYAPLTEEPAKWLVLLIPAVRNALTQKTAVPIALATGLGFGLGEIGFVAEQVTRFPALADLPFWQFGGFFLERVMVCFLHGAMLLFAFRWLAEGRAFWPGALLGIAIHYGLNFPIYVAGLDILPIAPEIWQTAITLYLVIFVVGGAAVVNHMVVGPRRPRSEA
ncbi:MAG: hypothetical protein KF723_02455 [Rhizobiaceae bacterium]|nr:hypothetical protein [Rhizobiaceae bacterium]